MNFGCIQDLPLILGGLLAVMALITVAHLLTTSTRRRRHDLAELERLRGPTPERDALFDLAGIAVESVRSQA